ncbi:glycoside hydrolase family 66 protein [Paenibacillus agaridevorans]|uniref:glycoside hydrolase family 66 protein n=1 Tax=Paenibacillus agaridevorans TaxID=171404 RepID=UPI001BE47120|nr:glycoside hydrolase family 66 protein [Paenibacillus agaridevorans]
MYALRKRRLSLLLAMSLLFMCVASVVSPPPQALASGSGGIERVYTDKARYNPGDTVSISVQAKNGTGSSWSGAARLEIFHLENSVYTSSQSLSLTNGQSTTLTFTWTAPSTDFRGYFVRIDAGTLGQGATAIDVSSDFTKYPRYGYISEFESGETALESKAKVDQLAQDYHINAWQFYDWMWRHDKMIKRTGGSIDSTWLDLFNREISWSTLQNQIDAVHDVNGQAMAYAMIYASRENYSPLGISPTWGIYEDSSHSNQFDVDFGDGSTYLYMFDPQNPNWQNYIHAEYIDAINTAGFDGIHVDQMGQRSNVYDYNGNSIDLSTRFSPFLDQAKSVLTANNPARDTLTYNIVDGTVNGWAVNDVSQNADLDFLYSEIWYLSDSYNQLKNYIEQLRANGGNKAVVLAAYMNYADNAGTRYEAESASLTNVATNTNHAGYTGSGFVDQFASNGDKVSFAINAPEAGDYSLVFRYGNNTGANSTLNLYVDGNFVQKLYFFNQSSWGTWKHDAWYQVPLTQGAHTVELRYESGNVGAVNLDSLTLGTFDEHSVRLADAMMSASGATHIELGDDNQMLPHEYYPNRSKTMRSSLKNAMKDHYNFITAYENLLFDPDVVPNDTGSQFVNLTGVSASGDGSANTVWYINKRTSDYNIVHLINLLGNDNQWRNTASQPSFQTNLPAKIYIGADEMITDVYLASPDLSDGETQELTFTSGTDAGGKYVSFTVPELKYWNMIYMKRSFSVPANDIYEAETAIKSNVSTNTNHAGYTGSGFVDGFSSTNDGVSFVVKSTASDDYALRFRYANGGSDATRDVYVDGKLAATVSFKSTGSWSTWGYGEITARLEPGHHTIVLWQTSGNAGAINLDHLDLDKTYIWQFDRQIVSVPAGYRITFRTGLPGWVHWGVNGWTGVTDTPLRSNGSLDGNLDHETSIGPFATGTAVDVTFLWDDNNNGVLEPSTDRWEGTDFGINVS